MIFNEKDLTILKGDVQDKPIYASAHNDVLVNELKFINRSSYTLLIAFRDGTISSLPSKSLQAYNETFIICHKKANRTGTIHTIDGPECSHTNWLRKQLLNKNNQSLYWEEIFSVETLLEHRDGVYIPSADVVVSVDTMYDTMAGHPFSKQAIHNGIVKVGDGFNSATDIGMAIRAIDNTGECGRLYVIINNKIAVITPRPSVVLENGVYITGLPSLKTTTSNNIRRDEKYSFSDALTGNCPFRFYHTVLEAKEALHSLENNTLQDAVDARIHEAMVLNAKREKDLLEQKLAKLKLEMLEKKTIADEEAAIREKKLADEQRQHEREYETLKAAHTKAVNDQKLLTDIIKLVTTVVATGWGLYKILK